MSLDLISEVWETLRYHIDLNERSEAADNLINLLIDNNCEPDEIKNAFRGNKEITKALKYYVEQHDIEDDDDEDEDINEDDW